MYRSLDPEKLLATIAIVRHRVMKVFPDSGLREVSGEVEAAARHVLHEGEQLRRPLWKMRLLIATGILALISAPVAVGYFLNFDRTFETLADFMQATDAGFNVLLLMAGGVAFLISTENRVKRTRALRSLNQLRSLAHVIDMHQLSKDPGMGHLALDEPRPLRRRPRVVRTDTDLWFYLSFCSDLLAVLGKLAAWYADFMTDRSVLQTVNGIENLCSDTSRKVWQKMNFIEVPPPDATPGALAISASGGMPSSLATPAG